MVNPFSIVPCSLPSSTFAVGAAAQLVHEINATANASSNDLIFNFPHLPLN
jgi:hypothetical protein